MKSPACRTDALRPYFGTLRISRQPNQDANRLNATTGVDQRNQNVGMMTSSSGNFDPTPAPYIASQGAIEFSLWHGDDSSMNQIQQPQYPDLTATVDDWAFQGVDTAFFGSIMNNTTFNFGADEDLSAPSWSRTTDTTVSSTLATCSWRRANNNINQTADDLRRNAAVRPLLI